jgi:2-hydroxycyclohexanecarboxyl-CoA dehydrogenase
VTSLRKGRLMTDLTGKCAIVVGVAPGNIGQAIARTLADLGADVIIAGRNPTTVTNAGRQLGLAGCRCDITVEEDLAGLTQLAIERHGHVDIAVNAVGRNLVGPLLDVSRADLSAVVEVQVVGTFLFLQAMIRAMDRGGSIIQISSVTSQALLPDHAAYMATKAAGDMLVRSAALDFGPRGIRINSISPGATADAPMAQAIMQDPVAQEAIRQIVPLRRIGTMQDVAEAAAWLASDRCFMTGENIQINGGTAIHTLQTIGTAQPDLRSRARAENTSSN